MKKLILVLLALVIVAAVAYGGYIIYQRQMIGNETSMMGKDESMMTESEDSMTKGEGTGTEEAMTDDSKMMMADSRYVEYSSKVLADTAGTKRVLFFYANWCPTCRPADANFKANLDKIPEGVTLIRVNYNDSDTDAEEKALADKYGVTYQHTFVQIDKDGNVVGRWNGGQITELLANIK